MKLKEKIQWVLTIGGFVFGIMGTLRWQGPAGRDGINGKDGINGINGVDGVNGKDGRDGVDGADGRDGKDGSTPYIGGNGNWFVEGVDTGVSGRDGKDGQDGRDGKDGQDGKDGSTPYIGENGNWFIDGIDLGVCAKGEDGENGGLSLPTEWYTPLYGHRVGVGGGSWPCVDATNEHYTSGGVTFSVDVYLDFRYRILAEKDGYYIYEFKEHSVSDYHDIMAVRYIKVCKVNLHDGTSLNSYVRINFKQDSLQVDDTAIANGYYINKNGEKYTFSQVGFDINAYLGIA